MHGGGWVAGTKDQIANYAKILAGKGYAVAGVEYSVAPAKTFPTPVIQVNSALTYLKTNANRLHMDVSRLFLAGDSGGASIAAQMANAVCVPSYAAILGISPSITRAQLAGLVLYCGPYDAQKINLEGSFGWFLRTVLWSYLGRKDFAKAPGYDALSVINYVTAKFPPVFISAGNGDPLLLQSRAFAEVLRKLGVSVDSLFFPENYAPAAPHEYQFNLDTEAGRIALERSLKFLSSMTPQKVKP